MVSDGDKMLNVLVNYFIDVGSYIWGFLDKVIFVYVYIFSNKMYCYCCCLIGLRYNRLIEY